MLEEKGVKQFKREKNSYRWCCSKGNTHENLQSIGKLVTWLLWNANTNKRMFNIIKVIKKKYKWSVYLFYHLGLCLFLFSDAGTGETSVLYLFWSIWFLIWKFYTLSFQGILNDFFTSSGYTSFVVAVVILQAITVRNPLPHCFIKYFRFGSSRLALLVTTPVFQTLIVVESWMMLLILFCPVCKI